MIIASNGILGLHVAWGTTASFHQTYALELDGVFFEYPAYVNSYKKTRFLANFE